MSGFNGNSFNNNVTVAASEGQLITESQEQQQQQQQQQERPRQLSYEKTRVVGGTVYVDTTMTTHDAKSTGLSKGTVVAGSSNSGDCALQIPAVDETMVSFVATDLTDKIKKSQGSSPVCSGDAASSCATMSSNNSGSSASTYPPLQPDPQVLNDLQAQAVQISNSLDQVLREFRGSLHGMTDLTVECMDCYNGTIDHTCDKVDAAIKSTYQMLAKAEELSQVVQPIPKLAQQIKEIKRMLDLFESDMQKTIG